MSGFQAPPKGGRQGYSRNKWSLCLITRKRLQSSPKATKPQNSVGRPPPGSLKFLRGRDGNDNSLSMTAHCSAVVKLLVSGVQRQLADANASAAQTKAALRALASHLNGVWFQRGLTNRLLLREEGRSLKYVLDPFRRCAKRLPSLPTRLTMLP